MDLNWFFGGYAYSLDERTERMLRVLLLLGKMGREYPRLAARGRRFFHWNMSADAAAVLLWAARAKDYDRRKPPLGQRARREVASIPARFEAEWLHMGTPFAILYRHPRGVVGVTEEGYRRLERGGSTAQRRYRLQVLKAVQREVCGG